MSATIQCSCGHTTTVADSLIGHHVSCTQCGQANLVGAAPRAARKVPAKPPRQQMSIHLSGGTTVLIGVTIAIAVLILVFKFGPARVHGQWQILRIKADHDVEDVITFAAQAYLSEQQLYDPTKVRGRPSVDGGTNFVLPYFAMSMPEKLRFFGVTQQGVFTGWYHTATGEIEADITYGGRTIGGLVVVDKPTGKFHITGRDLNDSPQAELDGRPLKIIYPPKVVEP